MRCDRRSPYNIARPLGEGAFLALAVGSDQRVFVRVTGQVVAFGEVAVVNLNLLLSHRTDGQNRREHAYRKLYLQCHYSSQQCPAKPDTLSLLDAIRRPPPTTRSLPSL